MTIAICDDSPRDLQLLLDYCSKFQPELTVITFKSSYEMLESYKGHPFDIIFLDIEMPALNGYEAAVRLAQNQQHPLIIFTTKTINYAVRGYGLAFRYLQKPITEDTFRDVLTLAIREVTPRNISFRDHKSDKILYLSDIIYFEVMQHCITFHLKNDEKFELRGSMSDVLAQLPGYWFTQVHKSFCVNLNYVDQANAKEVVLTNGVRLPIGRNYKADLNKKITVFIRGSTNYGAIG